MIEVHNSKKCRTHQPSSCFWPFIIYIGVNFRSNRMQKFSCIPYPVLYMEQLPLCFVQPSPIVFLNPTRYSYHSSFSTKCIRLLALVPYNIWTESSTKMGQTNCHVLPVYQRVSHHNGSKCYLAINGIGRKLDHLEYKFCICKGIFYYLQAPHTSKSYPLQKGIYIYI